MTDTIVIVKECSAGNAEVGEMWLETGVFDVTATLADVLEWERQFRSMRGRLMITVPKATP